jgi:hypothetical protein
MIGMGYFLFKIQRRWRSKSKSTAELEKKRPKSLLIRNGPRKGTISGTESRFEGYTKQMTFLCQKKNRKKIRKQNETK